MPLIPRLRLFWTGSIRRRLMLGVCGLVVTVMAAFVFQTVERQRQFLESQSEERSVALAETLAVNSTSWVLASDLAGLAEVTGSARHYPDLRYVMVLAPDGRVLSHSDTSLVGRYVSDMASLKLLSASGEAQVVIKTPELMDMAAPIQARGLVIGWARVGVGQERVAESLRDITWQGVYFAGAAIVLTALLAWVAGTGLSRGLDRLVEATQRVAAGNAGARAGMKREDELGALSDAFDGMAATLEKTSSKLRTSERDLRELLANLPAAVLICRPDGTVSYANEAARRTLDIAAAELQNGQVLSPRWSYIREDGSSIPQGETPATRAMERGQPVRNCVLGAVIRAGAEPRWLHVNAFPDLDAGGKVRQVVMSFLDVSERRKAEQELRRYKDQLEETVQRRTAELVLARDAAEAANKAKSVFLANMSHELRTPLNAILGFSAMMRRDPETTESQREKLDIINRSGDHLLALINDVLEMAKIEAGRMQLEIATFDLGGMVRDVADMMRLRAQEKGLLLQLDQSSAFPRYIKGDEERLRQVLVNLVGNAVKFTEHGSVIIRLGVKQNAASRLMMEVEDTGPGIKPEDQKRLFQPFVQLAEGGAQKGTGLGLTITRQFVQLMGGTIGIESTVGTGSIFRVDLPVEIASGESIKAMRAVEHTGEVAGLAPGQPSYRILIAEDQRDNQLLLAQLMTGAGLEAKVAENGEQCIKLFQEWQPHLIWMDQRMPIMDGVEATRCIRTLPGGREVKIVAVTASVFKEQQQELLDAGMDDFVRKPYRFHEIFDCLSKHLGVKYVYRSDAPPAEAAPGVLTPAMLAALPEAVRGELWDALESLHSDRIAAVIRQASATDPKLGRTLTRLAENFNYPAILDALASDKAPIGDARDEQQRRHSRG